MCLVVVSVVSNKLQICEIMGLVGIFTGFARTLKVLQSQGLENYWKLQSMLESPWILVLTLSNPDSQVAKRRQTQKHLQDKITHVAEELKKTYSRLFFALNGVLQKWEMCSWKSLKRLRTFCSKKGTNPVTSKRTNEKGPLGKKKQPVSTNCGRVINTVMFWWLQASFRACLHEAGGPQVGELTCGKLSHLTCKRDHIKMRDCMDRRVTPPKRVTSPTWGPPPPCKQALRRI